MTFNLKHRRSTECLASKRALRRRRTAMTFLFSTLAFPRLAPAQSIQERIEERLRKAAERLTKRPDAGMPAASAPESKPPAQPASAPEPLRGRAQSGVDLDINDTGSASANQVLWQLQHRLRGGGDQIAFWQCFGRKNGEPIEEINPNNPLRVEFLQQFSALRGLGPADRSEVLGRLVRDLKAQASGVALEVCVGGFRRQGPRAVALLALFELFPEARAIRLAYSTRPVKPNFNVCEPDPTLLFDKDPTKLQRASDSTVLAYLSAHTANFVFQGKSPTSGGVPADVGATVKGLTQEMLDALLKPTK